MSTIYHVTKRENDGREWKVFIQGSDKVIKLFPTQQEALEYATKLAKNKMTAARFACMDLTEKCENIGADSLLTYQPF